MFLKLICVLCTTARYRNSIRSNTSHLWLFNSELIGAFALSMCCILHRTHSLRYTKYLQWQDYTIKKLGYFYFCGLWKMTQSRLISSSLFIFFFFKASSSCFWQILSSFKRCYWLLFHYLGPIFHLFVKKASAVSSSWTYLELCFKILYGYNPSV